MRGVSTTDANKPAATRCKGMHYGLHGSLPTQT